jgi:hypothetical protein
VKPTCQQIQAWAARSLQEQAGVLGDPPGPDGSSGMAAGTASGPALAPAAALQNKAIPVMLLSMCGTSDTEYVCKQIVQELKDKVRRPT